MEALLSLQIIFSIFQLEVHTRMETTFPEGLIKLIIKAHMGGAHMLTLFCQYSVFLYLYLSVLVIMPIMELHRFPLVCICSELGIDLSS